MKFKVRMLSILLLGLSGCTWVPYAVKNLVLTPIDYAQECAFRVRIHQQACDVWAKLKKEDPTVYSPAYAKGFKAGFVDYIESNGTGEPPAIPPVHMQIEGYRTPEAFQAIQDWYAGFRHGTHIARETGEREKFLVPISLPPQPPVGTSQLYEPVFSPEGHGEPMQIPQIELPSR